jgi:hypothetical protein
MFYSYADFGQVTDGNVITYCHVSCSSSHCHQSRHYETYSVPKGELFSKF